MNGDEITTGKFYNGSASVALELIPLDLQGSIRATDAERKAFAVASHAWNM